MWQINEETYRNTLEASRGSTSAKTGPQIYYGSMHDILSYPCEVCWYVRGWGRYVQLITQDGKPGLVQAASASIHGPHGQHIENIHLQTYESDDEFWTELYAKKYRRLLSKAGIFFDQTGGPGDDALVFIRYRSISIPAFTQFCFLIFEFCFTLSCGFDACEHEYESMQRHQRRVPASFYHRFTKDATALADQYARGRLISVLEGGYSDRALMSGAMAHIAGLSGEKGVDEAWWSIENLSQV